jgi:hypothetical protein
VRFVTRALHERVSARNDAHAIRHGRFMSASSGCTHAEQHESAHQQEAENEAHSNSP